MQDLKKKHLKFFNSFYLMKIEREKKSTITDEKRILKEN